jgi:hypothetical protein
VGVPATYLVKRNVNLSQLLAAVSFPAFLTWAEAAFLASPIASVVLQARKAEHPLMQEIDQGVTQ